MILHNYLTNSGFDITSIIFHMIYLIQMVDFENKMFKTQFLVKLCSKRGESIYN